MAKATYVQQGDSVDYTPSSAVAAGDVIVQGTLVGVAKVPIAANVLGALAVRGVFDVVKDSSNITAGAALFWDSGGNPVGGTAGTGAATTTRAGNTFMGFALAAAGTSVTAVRAILRSVDSTSAETLALADLSDISGPVTYTAGKVLVADGDSFESVAISGDATLAANGALTIAPAAITAAKLASWKDGNVASAADSLAIPVTARHVSKTTGADAEALTLANGVADQRITITLVVDGGGDGTLTPATKTGFATVVLADAGDSVCLEYVNDTVGWILVGTAGVAAPPVIS